MRLSIRTPIRTSICLGAILSIALVAPLAHAEAGDYSFWDTLKHLVSPPKADNPVKPLQRTGEYPLKSNPSNFEDGFRPGGYLRWQTVQLAPETGAVCGNGSPFKFFVNRVANTSNTIIYMEGGGACWDYESCSGKLGVLGARNPNGIPDDYMKLTNPAASLVSPFVFRLHPSSRVKTQDWNMIYIPYCTGDVYTGDKVAVYTPPAGSADTKPLVWHHNGLRNTRAVLSWAKDNLQRPTQMLVTGCSAGGVGSMSNYHHVRRDMEPTKSFLINDSGPVFTAPQGSDINQFPSQRLHAQIRGAWGLDAGIFGMLEREVAGFQRDNLGTLYRGLANRWSSDRLGHTHFWEDINFSRYSYYRFFADVGGEPDRAKREAAQLARWYKDTERLYGELSQINNFGGYFPRFRPLTESHCTTVADFKNGDVQEQNLELSDFIESVLDGKGAVIDAAERDTRADKAKPFNLFYWLIDNVLR
jgi:Pectinacetylesterase